jgi:hypothetical protein
MECIAEKTLNKYLPNLKTKEKMLDLKNIPAFLKAIYSFNKMLINDEPYLVINIKGKELGPRDFKKHGKILKEKSNYTQIWCLRELHFHKVQRMIQNGLNFIIEGKQVHLPAVSISIKPEKIAIKTGTIQLNGLATNILIREILVGDLSGKNKLDLANIFEVNQMTVGRAIEPILINNLCYEKKEGVSKIIFFQKKAEIWEFLKTTGSPVKETIYIDKILKGLPYSGVTALSIKTMLADDRIQTYAMCKKEFKRTVSTSALVLGEFAVAKIELWDRNPILIQKSCINPIDIYLINKTERDERVQIELESLLKEYGLGKKA